MNCANLAATNGQQAPTSRPTVSDRQSERLDPTQTASISKNLTVGQIRSASRPALTMVRIEFETPANSRSCSQPMRPPIARGGAIGASIAWRTKVSWRTKVFACASIVASPLAQPDAGVVPVHRGARDERDRQVDRHGDGD